jgi:hypothetical protein
MSEVGSVTPEEREAGNAAVYCISVASNPHCDRMAKATQRILDATRAAVRAERERCAGIAENAGCLTYTCKHDIAAAIRAKPKEPTDGN